MAELDLYHNPRFVEFRKQLEKAGYSLSGLWSCNTGHHNHDTGKKFKYDNLTAFQVVPNKAGLSGPVHPIIIVQNWGRDGFGLFLDSENGRYDDIIREIVHGNHTVYTDEEGKLRTVGLGKVS